MKKKGVTIIELVVTFFILSIGVVGVLSVMRRPIEYTTVSISTLKAQYLAMEGLEIIRNERDRVWIREETMSREILVMRTLHLNVDPIPGTKFKREVLLEEVDLNNDRSKIKAIVTISWTEREKDYQFSLQGDFYNWL